MRGPEQARLGERVHRDPDRGGHAEKHQQHQAIGLGRPGGRLPAAQETEGERAGRQHQRRRDHHERGVPGHHVEIHERPAREGGEHGVLERAQRHRGHERDLLRRVLVALVEERRDPGQVGQRDGHVGDQQLAEALAVRHQRPDPLCGHHEHAGVVGVEHQRGAGGVQHQPAAAPGVQRDQERQRGEDHEEHQRGVGAGLGAVEHGKRGDGRHRGSEQARTPVKRAHAQQVDERHGGRAQEDRGHADPGPRVAELHGHASKEVVQRGRDRGVVHLADDVEQPVVRDDPVRVDLVGEQALVNAPGPEDEGHEGERRHGQCPGAGLALPAGLR